MTRLLNDLIIGRINLSKTITGLWNLICFGINGSATPLSKTLLFMLLTSIRSRIEEECLVTCVGSEISWLKIYSNNSSDILLGTSWAIVKTKSPIIIMSDVLVLQA